MRSIALVGLMLVTGLLVGCTPPAAPPSKAGTRPTGGLKPLAAPKGPIDITKEPPNKEGN